MHKIFRQYRKVLRDVPAIIFCVVLLVWHGSSALNIHEELVAVADLYTPFIPSDSFHLSIVVVGRNDRWGGHRFVDRLQLFINFTTMLACEVGSERAELVVVEWNPLPTEARLTDVLVWPRLAALHTPPQPMLPTLVARAG
jgi:hypothetical protein